MNIKFGICVWILIHCSVVSAQTATLSGQVKDAENGEPILFGNVALFQNGVLVTGVETDFDGNYAIDSLEIGKYDVEASYVGYSTKRIEGVQIVEGKNNQLNIEMSIGMILGCPQVTQCYFPLIDQSDNTQGQIFTSDQLRHRGRAY